MRCWDACAVPLSRGRGKTLDYGLVMSRVNVVYSIPCKDCDKKYIGQTATTLKDRITRHKSDCKLRPERCALAEHVYSMDHQMDFESTKILASQTHYTKRLFMEMVHIAQENGCINKKTDIKHLSEMYSYLLWQGSGEGNSLSLTSFGSV